MSKTETKPKKGPGGRPSEYRDEYAENARNLCLLIPGITEAEMCRFLKTGDMTLRKWQDEHPEFLGAIEEGKHGADMKVVGRLYNRCMGMWVTEEKAIKVKDIEYDPATGKKIRETEKIEKVEVKRYVLPNVQAIQYFLSNRTRTREHPWYRHAGGDRLDGKSTAPHANDSTERDMLNAPDSNDHLSFMAHRYEVAPPVLEHANGKTHAAAANGSAANGSMNGSGHGHHGEDGNGHDDE